MDYINLPQAWDYTTGSADVLVGVLDSGIDGTHPELSGMLVRNLCRDFTGGSQVVVTSPEDPCGHGTHVAGIIAAAGNNECGITGTAWNVGLVSLRVFDDNGRGTVAAVVSAINYAESVDIPILNFSGGWEGDVSDNTAFTAAVASYSGVLICAAGNAGEDNDGESPWNPASYEASNIISVGAINSTGDRCDFSNYGAVSVDIYAPGEDVLSTYPEHICENDVVFEDGTRLCEISSSARAAFEDYVDSNQITWDFFC